MRLHNYIYFILSKNIIYLISSTYLLYAGLLPGVQRHDQRGQRGERPPLHTAAVPDHPQVMMMINEDDDYDDDDDDYAQEHPGHQDSARDPQ